MVKMACQSCGKGLRFQEKYLGRKIHCPQCGHPQVLETADVDAEALTHASPSPDRASRDRSLSYPTSTPQGGAFETSYGALPHGSGHPDSFLAPPQEPDEIGRLGGYRILQQLGAGGMGVVYLAEDISLKRKIAIKVLPPGAVTDSNARDRFFREARAAANLEHENIITIHQVDEDRGVVFLAMPLLKGRPLDQYLSERGHNPLPVDEILRIGRETAAGLAAAHDHDVVHRDIKPANIWLEDITGRNPSNRPFRVKILDFGLARSSRDGASLTQTGIIVGTPSYMSPEQARNPKVDSRSDLFSLGCVLYEVSTGRRPFSGNDAMAVLSSLAVDVPMPPVELNDEIPFELSDLIMELLEKDPRNRPRSARDVEERLHNLETGAANEPSGRTEQITTSPALRKRDKTRQIPIPRGVNRLWIWVGGGAALVFSVAIVVLGVVATTTRDAKPAAKANEVKPVKNAINDAKDKKIVEEKPPEVIDFRPPPPPPPKFEGPDGEFFPKEPKKGKKKDDKEFGPKKGPPGFP